MIQISLEMKGDEALIAASNRYRKGIPRVTLNATRRVLRRAVTVIKKDIRSRSEFGRNLFTKRGSGPDLNKLVTVIRARGTEDSIDTGIRLKGLPKIIEQGGVTEKHTIKPRSAPRLAFQGTGRFSGGLIFAKVVNHPGSTVRPHGYAAAVHRTLGPLLTREVGTALANLKAATFGQHA